MSSCTIIKALGLVNNCAVESTNVQKESSNVQKELISSVGSTESQSTLLVNETTTKLTSDNKKYSTIFTVDALYIIHNHTKEMSLVKKYTLMEEKGLLLSIENGVLQVKSILQQSSFVLPGTVQIFPLNNNNCKIKNFVRLRDDGILFSSECGSYNKWS